MHSTSISLSSGLIYYSTGYKVQSEERKSALGAARGVPSGGVTRDAAETAGVMTVLEMLETRRQGFLGFGRAGSRPNSGVGGTLGSQGSTVRLESVGLPGPCQASVWALPSSRAALTRSPGGLPRGLDSGPLHGANSYLTSRCILYKVSDYYVETCFVSCSWVGNKCCCFISK